MKLERKFIFGLVGYILVLCGLVATLLLNQQQIVTKKASVSRASLSLLPETGNFPINQSQTVQIILNTGERPVVGVDVSLSFDSSMIRIESVQPGSLFQGQIVFKNEVQENKILLSLGSFTPFTGTDVYGVVTFTPIKTGNSSLSFNPSPFSKIAEQNGGNILGEIKSGSYSFIDSGSFR